MEETILERVVQSELDIPHALLEIHGNAEPNICENIMGKWNSLKNWFIDSDKQECECKKVLKITNDVIRNIIQNAALIVQIQNWGISRKDDYKKFLELFLKCEDIDEAENYQRTPSEYRNTTFQKQLNPCEDDSINVSIYDEEPAEFLRRNLIHGLTEKRKTKEDLRIKTLEKMMAERENILKQARKQKILSCIILKESKIIFLKLRKHCYSDTGHIFAGSRSKYEFIEKWEERNTDRNTAWIRKAKKLCTEMSGRRTYYAILCTEFK